MKPYYERDGITIFLGDCLEVMQTFEDLQFDACITDPPYGIGSWSSTGGNSISQKQANEINKWDIRPTEQYFSEIIRISKVAVIWGGNYFLDILGSCKSPLIWDKDIRGMHFADGEFAWTNFKWGTLRILNYPMASSETKNNKVHPTQKPIPVISWSILQAHNPNTIIDPFLGSGTTLVTAQQLGRRAIGIDISEEYCRIAVDRLRQPSLFSIVKPSPPAPQPQQLALDTGTSGGGEA